MFFITGFSLLVTCAQMALSAPMQSPPTHDRGREGGREGERESERERETDGRTDRETDREHLYGDGIEYADVITADSKAKHELEAREDATEVGLCVCVRVCVCECVRA